MKAYGYMGSTSLHAPAVLFVLVQATTCTLSPVLKADTVEAHLRRRGGDQTLGRIHSTRSHFAAFSTAARVLVCV